MPWILPWILIGVLSGFLFGGPAHAHPVAWQGAWGLMGMTQPDMSDWFLSYSVRSHWALAARGIRFEGRDGASHRLALGQSNFLLHRWNEVGSQGNVYLSAGGGAEWTPDGASRAVGLGAIEADWESHQFYVSGKVQSFGPSPGELLHWARVRTGFAPYEAEFNELNAWFMLQAEYRDGMRDPWRVTPLFRFYINNVLWELGSDFEGQWSFNFMIHW